MPEERGAERAGAPGKAGADAAQEPSDPGAPEKTWQQVSDGGEAMAKSLEGNMGDGHKFFDFEGNKYRRRAGAKSRAIHDVLAGNEWKPYIGKDALSPGLFGDECEDPLGGGGMGRKPKHRARELEMVKAEPMVLFLKANIAGYTNAKGTFVAPHTDSRPAGEWYVHKEHKDGTIEHRKVVATGKPAFAGPGKKIRHVTQFADGTAQAKGEGGHVTKHASVDEAKAYLDRP
jgi:hypothetical protein